MGVARRATRVGGHDRFVARKRRRPSLGPFSQRGTHLFRGRVFIIPRTGEEEEREIRIRGAMENERAKL